MKRIAPTGAGAGHDGLLRAVADATEAPRRGAGPRKPWAPPRVRSYGDLRGLTLGGLSPGAGDSLFPNTRP